MKRVLVLLTVLTLCFACALAAEERRKDGWDGYTDALDFAKACDTRIRDFETGMLQAEQDNQATANQIDDPYVFQRVLLELEHKRKQRRLEFLYMMEDYKHVLESLIPLNREHKEALENARYESQVDLENLRYQQTIELLRYQQASQAEINKAEQDHVATQRNLDVYHDVQIEIVKSEEKVEMGYFSNLCRAIKRFRETSIY